MDGSCGFRCYTSKPVYGVKKPYWQATPQGKRRIKRSYSAMANDTGPVLPSRVIPTTSLLGPSGQVEDARSIYMEHIFDHDSHPIQIDQNNNVLSGWGYVLAARQLGIPKIRVQVAHVDPLSSPNSAQSGTMRIHDHQTARPTMDARQSLSEGQSGHTDGHSQRQESTT